MEIRHAEERDLDTIMGIYAHAREFMAATGNPRQWGPRSWPPEELIREDIRTRKGYVCVCDGRVVGVFYYDCGEDIDPTYRVIDDGSWADEDAYGVVHRIASDGSVRGVGTFCIDWAFGQCGHLRIDTHADNVVMQNLLAKLGFERRGIIYVTEDNDPRIAYEKLARPMR